MSACRERVDRARADVRKNDGAISAWMARKSDAQRDLLSTDEHNARMESEFRRAGDVVESLSHQIEGWRAKCDDATHLSATTCPTCYRDVDPSRIARVVRLMETKNIAPLKEQRRAARANLATASDVFASATTARTAAESAFVAAEKAMERITRDVRESASILREKERELTIAETTASNEHAEENPHASTLASVRADIAEKQAALGTASEEEQRARTAADAATFCVGVFRDLRLWIIEQALLDFEICVNNALSELGLNEWRVSFDVERQTAAGTVSKGFTVLIQSPESGGPVPWEGWSGGETQRLRLAGAMGLSDLVRAQCGFKSSIEVWDEPTQHLSREGVEDMLRFFRDRAREQGRQVWLVDHVTQPGWQFDGTVVVVSDRRGSHIGARPKINVPRETL